METSFAPSGERSLAVIRDGVIAEGDAAESVSLEAKSDIDLAQRLGVAKVAKFILGVANRQPDVAQRHFQGYAVMVLGARKDSAPGVPGGVEAHELADRLRPYLGPDGPRWDLARLPADDGREVLFIVVDSPKAGDPPYPCHKDFQPADTQDKKHALQNGAVYVRGKSNTLPAKASELLALVSRGQVSQTPAVAVSLRCEGSAITLHDADEMFGKLTRVLAEKYREKRAESANRPQRPNYPGAFLPHEHYGQPNLSGSPKHVEEVLTAWKERAQSGWPQALEKIAGAVLAPLGFTVENSAASYLNNPLMIVTIDGAYGVDNERLDDLHFKDVLPPVEPRAKSWVEQLQPSFKAVRPALHQREMEWHNTESGIQVRLHPEALRPSTPWSPRYPDLVVIARDEASDSLRVTWSLTAEGIGEAFEGESTLPVDTQVGVHGLYEQFFTHRQTKDAD